MVKMVNEQLKVQDLGLISYREAYDAQRRSVDDCLENGQETVFICEHHPVVTLGRLAKEDNILQPHDALRVRGLEILPVDRGGDVTLHAPGQVVLYPILNLQNSKKDLKLYFYKLEQVAIDFLGEFDILACRIKGQTGVWVGPKKIGSLGIGVKRWVTFHGLSVNVNTDLSLFSFIRPCDLDVQMTSIQEIKRRSIDVADAKSILVRVFRKQFGF